MSAEGRAARLVLAALVLVGAFLATASAAGAHVLLVDRAETAAERYASFKQGGGYGSLTVRGPGGDQIDLRVDRYDAGRCISRGIHRRVCPVEYEGKDYSVDDCRLGPLASDPDSDTRDCFEKNRITCVQVVTVTLRGRHITRTRRTRAAQAAPDPAFRDLTVTGGELTCRESGDAPSVPAPPPTG